MSANALLRPADVLGAVERERETIVAATRFVNDHPELAHEEHACSTYLADALEARGYQVERGIGGMATAFVARPAQVRPGKTIAIVLEYDAVAFVGPDGSLEASQACAHGPVSGGGVGAALALAALGDRFAANVVVVGCPADEAQSPIAIERGGGKAGMVSTGLWDTFDAALYAHPESEASVFRESVFMERHRAVVGGPGSADPASVEAAFRCAPKMLELAARAPEGLRLERLVIEAGVLAGTVPILTADFGLRSRSSEGIEAMIRFLRAELPEAQWTVRCVVRGLQPHAGLTAVVRRAFTHLGWDFEENPSAMPYTTDFGNVSERIPAALIGLGRSTGWPMHTREATELYRSPVGDVLAVDFARVLALTCALLAGMED